MNRRQVGTTLFAAGHLVLVVCGAAGWTLFSGRTVPGQALRLYGALSGSEATYDFFAPEVGSALRARFTLTDGAGRNWEDDLEPGRSWEADMRVRKGIELAAYPELREALAQSWAAALLGRHPEAVQVVVRIEVHDLPTMAEYRRGVRPRWELLYEGRYSRTERLPSSEEK